jgi:hypothetical protein
MPRTARAPSLTGAQLAPLRTTLKQRYLALWQDIRDEMARFDIEQIRTAVGAEWIWVRVRIGTPDGRPW